MLLLGSGVNKIVSSVDYLLLYKSILIHLGDVFSRVDLIMTRLCEWDDQASAQATAGEHSHDAEVEEQSAASVHLLGAQDTGVA